MAIRVTRWNFTKIFLAIFDCIILLFNTALFSLIFYLIQKEYENHGSLKLFIIPFLISIINVVIDIHMNKINLMMKYAGHNRYGMITRFFMFYFILTIIIYSDQREKYIIEENEGHKGINDYIGICGKMDVGFLVFSMILSFFVIDVQNSNQILKKKRKKKQAVIPEEMNIMEDPILEE